MINWAESQNQLAAKLSALPDHYSDEHILHDYAELLQAVREPEVQAMEPKHRAFILHERFERFAISYSTLFNIAARRDPIPLESVKQMLLIASQQRAQDEQALTEQEKEQNDEEARQRVIKMIKGESTENTSK